MNVFIKLMGSGVAVQAVMIISTLIFSRIFLIEDFGELAIYASFGSIMGIVGGLRFDYLILKDSVFKKINGYMIANSLSFLINMIVVFILFFLQKIFGFFVEYSIFVLFLFGLGFSVFNNLTQYMISLKKYSLFIKLRLIQVFSVFIIAIFLYFSDIRNMALLLAYGGSQLIIGLGGFFLILKKNSALIKVNEIRKFFLENLVESSKNSLISFMQYSTPLMPIVIGSVFFDKKTIGAYFIFSQMISAPLSVIRRNMLIYFNGELSSKNNFKILFVGFLSKKNMSLFLTVTICSLLFVYIFRDSLTLMVLGQQWQSYSYLLLPLLFYFVFDCIFQPFTTLLPLWGNVDFSLYSEVSRFFMLAVLLPLSISFFDLVFLNFILFYILIMLSVYVIILFKVCSVSSVDSLKGISQ